MFARACVRARVCVSVRARARGRDLEKHHQQFLDDTQLQLVENVRRQLSAVILGPPTVKTSQKLFL